MNCQPSAAYRLPARAGLAAALLLASWLSPVRAQTRGAELVHQEKAIYPEKLAQGLKQGNVMLIGRIDTQGQVQDLKAVGTSHPDFVEPSVKAIRLWQFKPALSNGKPIEIATNIGMRFRLEGNQRGQLTAPFLGDLAVFPADSSGNRTAPEGFPIRLGSTPKLRVEPVLDLSPAAGARTLRVQAHAVSPSGRRILLFDRPVAVRAGAHDVTFPFSAPVGSDWEEGIWLIRLTADGADVGGGQFWLARDPARFDFAAALRKLTP